jgi:hypothetical protein
MMLSKKPCQNAFLILTPMPGGDPGQRPAHLTARAFGARHKEYRPLHQAASANTKFAKSSNIHLFFSVR